MPLRSPAPTPATAPRRRLSSRALIASTALVVVAAVSGAAYLRRPFPRVPAFASTDASPASTTAPGPLLAPNPGAHPAGRVPGDVTQFILTLDADLAVAQDGKRKPIGTMRTAGTLSERTIQVTTSGVVSLLAVEGPAVTLGGAHQADVEAALVTGIVVERDAQGITTRARLPKDVSSNGARALRTIADLFQWAPAPAGPAWEAREATSLGASDAKYTRPDPEHVRKVFDGADPSAGRARMRGELLATMDGARVANLHGDETITVPESAGLSTTHVSIDRVQTGADLATALRLSGALEDAFGPWMALDAPLPRFTESDDATLARKVAGSSLAELEALLDARDHMAMARATEALGAYARLHPDACAPLAHAAAAGDPRDLATHARVQALVSAGSPEAQRALLGVAKAWSDPQESAAVVAALGTVPSPTVETVDGLRALRDDASTPALAARNADVALGNVAGNLRDVDPVRADAIAADLGDRLGKVSDPADAVATLMGLGNSRSERAHDIAARYLENGDAIVRRMAVYAYGRAMDDDARARLRSIADTDPDANVRDEATRMLGI